MLNDIISFEKIDSFSRSGFSQLVSIKQQISVGTIVKIIFFIFLVPCSCRVQLLILSNYIDAKICRNVVCTLFFLFFFVLSLAGLPLTSRRLGEVAVFVLATTLSSGMTFATVPFRRGRVAISPNR
jgi:hypothetical protein